MLSALFGRPLRAVMALVAIGTLIAFAVIAPRLPDSVAMHFDARGEPDRWGPPSELLMLAVAPSVVWVVIAWCQSLREVARIRLPLDLFGLGVILALAVAGCAVVAFNLGLDTPVLPVTASVVLLGGLGVAALVYGVLGDVPRMSNFVRWAIVGGTGVLSLVSFFLLIRN